MNTLNDYQKTAHQAVHQLFNEVDKLKQKGKYIRQENKHRFEQKIKDLDMKKEKLRVKYNAYSAAADNASKDLREGFEEARGALIGAWQDAKEEFVS